MSDEDSTRGCRRRDRLTMAEIAPRLGVSVMTVHRAVTGKPDISPRTRERILQEVERLGWSPNFLARGLREGRTLTLAVLVADLCTPPAAELVAAILDTAETYDRTMIVAAHGNDAARAQHQLRLLRSRGIDGLIYCPADAGEGALLNLLLASIPAVVILERLPEFDGPTILADHRYGGFLAGSHLLELGHRRLAFLEHGDARGAVLWDGFQEPLRERLLLPTPARLRLGTGVPDDRMAIAVREVLLSTPRPTGLFCASAQLAALALRAALSLHLRVPEDLSVVCYGDTAEPAFWQVPPTAVALPNAEIGRRAASTLLTPPRPGAARCSVVRPRLVCRQSSGK